MTNACILAGSIALAMIAFSMVDLVSIVQKSETDNSCKDETSWMNDGYSQQWLSAALTTKGK